MLKQLATTITHIATQSVVDAVRVLALQVVAVIVGLTIGLTGLGFLCAAIYMALEHRYGGWQAATAVALGLLVLCAACVLGAIYIGRKPSKLDEAEPVPPLRPAKRSSDAAVLAALIQGLAQPRGASSTKGDLAYLAAVAGLGLAPQINPPTRRKLVNGLSNMVAAKVRGN